MPDIAPLAPHRVVPLTEIRPAESNPRKIPPKAIELLAKSLSRFGWQQPLVVDKTGELIVGHTRLLAAQHLKLTEAPVVYAENLTDDEVRAYRIADNRTHDFTTWDYPELVVELEYLSEDFADELALQDWQAIAEEFDTKLDLEPEVKSDMTGTGFEVTIVFGTKDQALAAERGLLELPGALDVRHKLRAQPAQKREGYIERLQKQETSA